MCFLRVSSQEVESYSNNFTDEDKFEEFEKKIKLLEQEIFYLKSKGLVSYHLQSHVSLFQVLKAVLS